MQMHISPNLANLRAEGLSAGLALPAKEPHRHRVLFRVLGKMRRWDQKALAMRFLVLEYEAKDFEFWTSKLIGSGQFYCEFTSFAL